MGNPDPANPSPASRIEKRHFAESNDHAKASRLCARDERARDHRLLYRVWDCDIATRRSSSNHRGFLRYSRSRYHEDRRDLHVVTFLYVLNSLG